MAEETHSRSEMFRQWLTWWIDVCRYEKEFDQVQDVFELQRNLNNAFAYDLVPSTSVITAALRAARRVNDFPTAVRVFEGMSPAQSSDRVECANGGVCGRYQSEGGEPRPIRRVPVRTQELAGRAGRVAEGGFVSVEHGWGAFELAEGLAHTFQQWAYGW
jgi:hypothetical protein